MLVLKILPGKIKEFNKSYLSQEERTKFYSNQIELLLPDLELLIESESTPENDQHVLKTISLIINSVKNPEQDSPEFNF